MKTNIVKAVSYLNNRVLIMSFFLLLSASIVSCRKDRLEQNPENQFNYIPPDYPEKPSGRYLKSIYVEGPGMGTSGTKVEFEYDKKKYVQSYIFRGFDSNDIAGTTLLEYDIYGNAIRIKLLDRSVKEPASFIEARLVYPTNSLAMSFSPRS